MGIKDEVEQIIENDEVNQKIAKEIQELYDTCRLYGNSEYPTRFTGNELAGLITGCIQSAKFTQHDIRYT